MTMISSGLKHEIPHTHRVPKVNTLLRYLHRICLPYSWACLKIPLVHHIIYIRWRKTDKHIFKTAACYSHSLVLGKTCNIHSHYSAKYGTFKTWPHATAMLQPHTTGPMLLQITRYLFIDNILTFQGNVHSAEFLPLCKCLAQVHLKSQLYLKISAIVSLQEKKKLTLRAE